ncbi:DUF3895 domain-containing protein [Paenibacillus glycanilyticus]|uniref:DUF3895 domain-containing protein n=1 Tax=Paenibacillus glycanilyticus TaxID=126569 RepID=UPI001910FDA1|nr:DUF3895 domain-containing protein [Paenibacillus glycanilyticus]
MILSVEERDQILAQLNERQRQYLSDYLVRGHRTVFANIMAKEKGFHIPEDSDPAEIERLLQDWIYVGYIDGGHVRQDLRCECGRPLRYQHQVRNKSTGEIKFFGIEHLKEHLGIGATTVAAVKKGFDAIDYELDELLTKWKNKWIMDPELLQVDSIPTPVAEQIKLGLPLLEKQIRGLKQNRIRLLPRKLTFEEKTPPKEVVTEIERDLFSWNEPPQTSQNDPFYLSENLKSAIQSYIKSGTQSARIISDLLILEHAAPKKRLITGKPEIYAAVCMYIERHYNVEITTLGAEDRIYTINS